MKAITLFFFCSFVFAFERPFHLSIEQEFKFEKPDNKETRIFTPQTNIFLQYNNGKVKPFVNTSLGIFSWVQIEPTYKEVYVGPSFQMEFGKLHIESSIGMGAEKDGKQINKRFGSSVFANRNNDNFLFVFETLGSGPWYQSIYYHSFSLRKLEMSAGLRYRKNSGIGPRFAINPINRLELWFTPLVRKDYLYTPKGLKHQYNPIAGFTYRF